MIPGNIGLTDINDKMQKGVDQAEKQLEAALAVLDDPKASADQKSKALQDVAIKMQKWTLATNMQSNTIKALSEGMKSIIQNVR